MRNVPKLEPHDRSIPSSSNWVPRCAHKHGNWHTVLFLFLTRVAQCPQKDAILAFFWLSVVCSFWAVLMVYVFFLLHFRNALWNSTIFDFSYCRECRHAQFRISFSTWTVLHFRKKCIELSEFLVSPTHCFAKAHFLSGACTLVRVCCRVFSKRSKQNYVISRPFWYFIPSQSHFFLLVSKSGGMRLFVYVILVYLYLVCVVFVCVSNFIIFCSFFFLYSNEM